MSMDPDTHVFVFGANLKGVHGAGAAYDAARFYGAIPGKGEGRMGKCYAIPTKDEKLQPRQLADIQASVETFLAYAAEHLNETFYVTRVGCGLAGYTNEQIAPMFADAPTNCHLMPEWVEILAR